MTALPQIVRADILPEQSQLHGMFKAGDFIDCYSGAAQLSPREAATIAMNFPFWVTLLLRLRNLLVSPFGLRGAIQHKNSIGIFPVVAEDENEIILGFDDSHLNFRISVFSAENVVYFATWVHRNNRFGRFYLALIMPFHKLIVHHSLQAVLRHNDMKNV